MSNEIRVTQIRSAIGRPRKHRLVLLGMGLTRMHKTVVLNDTPEIRGMIKKVEHLVAVEA
jgi:large subunit ribosomal protein L30